MAILKRDGILKDAEIDWCSNCDNGSCKLLDLIKRGRITNDRQILEGIDDPDKTIYVFSNCVNKDFEFVVHKHQDYIEIVFEDEHNTHVFIQQDRAYYKKE